MQSGASQPLWLSMVEVFGAVLVVIRCEDFTFLQYTIFSFPGNL